VFFPMLLLFEVGLILCRSAEIGRARAEKELG